MSILRNILVIRLSSLGDVLLTMPAVKAIKEAFPSSRISWLVEGGPAPLLSHQPFVDEVIEFPRSTFTRDVRSGRLLDASRTLQAFFGRLRRDRYDAVVDFHGIMKSAVFARATKCKRRIGFNEVFAKEGSWLAYGEKVGAGEKRMHKVRRNMLLASYLGASELPPELDLSVSDQAAAYVDQFLSAQGVVGPLFAVNPFCSKGSAFKRWDLNNYGALVSRVADATGAKVLILWGPEEKEEADRLKQMSGEKAIVACPTTVSQVHALLKRTDLYIGGDTGVMHLAALAGVPVVAIFGPTDHLINGPYGEGHTVLRKELPCSPCRDKDCGSRKCLGAITVDEVFGEVCAAWDRAGRN